MYCMIIRLTTPLVLYVPLHVVLYNYYDRSTGANPYMISVNDVEIVGFWGYIELFNELLEQVS